MMQVTSLNQAPDVDKQSLIQFLTFIEDTLHKYWSDYDGFINLQERILSLRMILEEGGAGDSGGNTVTLVG